MGGIMAAVTVGQAIRQTYSYTLDHLNDNLRCIWPLLLLFVLLQLCAYQLFQHVVLRIGLLLASTVPLTSAYAIIARRQIQEVKPTFSGYAEPEVNIWCKYYDPALWRIWTASAGTILSAAATILCCLAISAIFGAKWFHIMLFIMGGLTTIYITTRLSWQILPVSIYEENFALRRSWQITSGRFWYGFCLILSIQFPVGLIAGILQMVVTHIGSTPNIQTLLLLADADGLFSLRSGLALLWAGLSFMQNLISLSLITIAQTHFYLAHMEDEEDESSRDMRYAVP